MKGEMQKHEIWRKTKMRYLPGQVYVHKLNICAVNKKTEVFIGTSFEHQIQDVIAIY